MPDKDVKISILALDDDDDDLYLITRIIEELGITNYKMYNDEMAFMIALSQDAHVCIIDHFLTHGTGLDILYQIKQRNDESFVIGYSGIKDIRIIIDYLNGDLDRFVDKGDPKANEKLQKYIMEGFVIAEKRIRAARAMRFFRSERENIIRNV